MRTRWPTWMASMSSLKTAAEIAALYQVKVSTIKTWARQGIIPVVKPTDRVLRFDLDAVRSAIAERGTK